MQQVFAKCALVVIAVLVAACYADDSVVHTELGDVRGRIFPTHRAFLGVPFVQPPVNELRFAKPVPAKSWAPSVIDATAFKPGCPQLCHLPPGACPEVLSEDCIYLNVYTPLNTGDKKLPIIVWFPGGHFEQGSAGSVLYDGTFFVSNQSQVILIAVNYRLGALGWLTDEKITELADGNFGLQDQLEGLRWVQQNAGAFGGDINQVTVAGQSAGSTSIAALLVSPASKGLFHKAILQSNPISLPFRYRSDASVLGQEVRRILNCDNIDCLRSKSTDEIVKAQHEAADKILIFEPLVSFLPWVPTVDQKLVPARFLEAIEKDMFQKDANGAPIPLIMGSVAEEAVIFVYMVAKKELSDLEYLGIVGGLFVKESINVLKFYPPTPIVGDKRPAAATLVTDYLFNCVNRYVAGVFQSHAKGSNSVYLYRFNHSLSFDAWGPEYPFCQGKVCHGADLPVLFQNSGNFSMNAQEHRMGSEMVAYWTNFAYTGNPNNGPSQLNLAGWPEFKKDDPTHLEFQTESTYTVKAFKKSQCDMFDKIGYWHGAGKKKNPK